MKKKLVMHTSSPSGALFYRRLKAVNRPIFSLQASARNSSAKLHSYLLLLPATSYVCFEAKINTDNFVLFRETGEVDRRGVRLGGQGVEVGRGAENHELPVLLAHAPPARPGPALALCRHGPRSGVQVANTILRSHNRTHFLSDRNPKLNRISIYEI